MTKPVLFFDKSKLDGVQRRQSDGALLAHVRVARTGIQLYRGSEVDPENEHGVKDKAVVRVYRPGSEVFSKDTMQSVAHRPVTNDHPKEMVTEKTWKDVAVGQTADEVSAEGIYLRVPLMVSDGAAISDIEGGKQELSPGYWSELDWTAGKNDAGESYDAVQRNIRFNHVAIVDRGRSGKKVRIGDEAGVWVSDEETLEDGEDKGVHTMANRTVTIDGLTIETTDQGAQAIEKLQGQIRTLTDAATTAKTAHDAALAAKDKDLATKDTEIAGLKAKVLDAKAIDTLVEKRSTLIAKARMVHKDAKIEGLTDTEIMRGVVTEKIKDVDLKDKSDAYIEARFDGLVEAAKASGSKVDDFRSVVRDEGIDTKTTDSKVRTAYDKMVEDMTNPKLGDVKAA
jgi:hypothetical protein